MDVTARSKAARTGGSGGMARYKMLQIRTAVFSSAVGVGIAALAFQTRGRLRSLHKNFASTLPPGVEVKVIIPAYGNLVTAGIFSIFAVCVSSIAFYLKEEHRKHCFLMAALLNTIAASICIFVVTNAESGVREKHARSGMTAQQVGMRSQQAYLVVLQTLALFTVFKAAGAYFWRQR